MTDIPAHSTLTGGSSWAVVVRAIEALPQDSHRSVLPFDLETVPVAVLDLSASNPHFEGWDSADTESLSAWVSAQLVARAACVGIGRYAENRIIYGHSPLFDGRSEPRTVHLGIDLFADAGTPVFAPLDARVHSFADNAGTGNYGPTVILEHRLAATTFHTLYGHLDRPSLVGLEEGKTFAAGDPIGRLGGSAVNGGWPPHLHFQIITDIGGWRGDFPGVAEKSELSHWLAVSPDPNAILRIPALWG